jgi:uncharacterized protein YcbX
MNEVVGVVAEIWRFPVKSMKGEKLAQAEITNRGIPGDRAYALIDKDIGKVVSAKSVRLFPNLLNCQAAFVHPPQAGSELPPVRITLPNGIIVNSDSGEADSKLSEFFKRNVTLARAAPDDFTIDQYYPDLENLDPEGRRDTFVEQKLGSAFFSEAGLASPVPPGSFFDLFPLTVVTTSTLKKLNELRSDSSFDQRRFRMNLIVDTQEDGFVENNWVSRALNIGDKVRIRIEIPDPRCVMTTLAQDELPEDIEILRTLARHNRVQVGDAGKFPCAGVYAVVETAGIVGLHDQMVFGGENP